MEKAAHEVNRQQDPRDEPRNVQVRRADAELGHCRVEQIGRVAAGAQEAIYSLLMMNNNFICASANVENLDPIVGDMPIVLQRKDDIELNCVLSNSFGFGGTNACLAFTRVDA